MVDVQSIEIPSPLPAMRRARVKRRLEAPEPSAPPTPSEAARSAGLRYLPDDVPGITRHSAGSGFTYKGPGAPHQRRCNTAARPCARHSAGLDVRVDFAL